MSRLLRGEAVEQAVAAGTLQIVLTAAPVRAARGMRRVPRLRRIVVAQALPVMMADHRRALAALRPVAAGTILAGRERGAVRLGAGQDVVHVRRIAAPVPGRALVMKKLISFCCACPPVLPPSDSTATDARIDNPILLFTSASYDVVAAVRRASRSPARMASRSRLISMSATCAS